MAATASGQPVATLSTWTPRWQAPHIAACATPARIQPLSVQWTRHAIMLVPAAMLAVGTLLLLSSTSLSSTWHQAAPHALRRLEDASREDSGEKSESREDDNKVEISSKAWRHDDQVKGIRDSRDGEVTKSGHTLHAIGDSDHTVLCEHYPETKLQMLLFLKVLRCTCTWEFEDIAGIILSSVVALVVMGYARQCGNPRRNNILKRSSLICSCTTVFALFNAALTGLERTACFTWADVCFVFSIVMLCNVPCCYCAAWAFDDPPQLDRDGLPIPGLQPEEEEEQQLLCCRDTSEKFGERVGGTPVNSRELGRP